MIEYIIVKIVAIEKPYFLVLLDKTHKYELFSRKVILCCEADTGAIVPKYVGVV